MNTNMVLKMNKMGLLRRCKKLICIIRTRRRERTECVGKMIDRGAVSLRDGRPGITVQLGGKSIIIGNITGEVAILVIEGEEDQGILGIKKRKRMRMTNLRL